MMQCGERRYHDNQLVPQTLSVSWLLSHAERRSLRSMQSERHEELAKFLTSRRTRLPPEACGLPALRRRRRTPGLRRDEVSALAGISTAYYTWIEQGRRFDVSTEILSAIAGALQLSAVEAAHLFTLAGKAAPRALRATADGADSFTAIQHFVACFEQGPALALTPWLDVTQRNAAAQLQLGIDAGENLIEAFFCGAGHFNDSAFGGALTALLRRNFASDSESVFFGSVIGRLYERSDAFRALWDAHVVDSGPSFDVEVLHPDSGRTRFNGVLVADPIVAGHFALFMHRCR
jgi:transcriptional regulator with XRE-family HTH domain